MTEANAVASSSAITLDSDSDPMHSPESIPTLSSLLLSTAESLAQRTKEPPKTSTSSFKFTANPHTLLSNPATPPYLATLLAQPLPQLQALPKTLDSLSTTLDSDLSTLAFTRYQSFLLSHASSETISTSFSTLSESLSSLLDSTLELEHSAASFDLAVRDIRLRRDKIRSVRDQLEPIEELLDSSKVVEQCVRTGQWNEAIQISNRIQTLRRNRYSSTTGTSRGEGILARVEHDVERALSGLKGKVLATLEERSLKLPGAVRGIGILRKINSHKHKNPRSDPDSSRPESDEEIEEEGLRLIFLSARWKCFKQELDQIEAQMSASGISRDSTTKFTKVTVEENDERTRWIKRWIEVWREIVGETIGMYTEVFLNHLPAAESNESVDEFFVPRPRLPATAPLDLFLSNSLSSLSSVLHHSLPALTSTASLSTLLTQLSYCSNSFIRHGLQFHSHLSLSSLFSSRISEIMLSEWEQAGKKWEMEWRNGWSQSGSTALTTTSSRLRRSGKLPIKDWLVVPEGTTTLFSTALPPPPAAATRTGTDWSHQPAPTLALLPPLAHLVNSYVQSLNSLRLLPPLSILDTLRKAQSRELERASRVLEAFVDAWLSSFLAAGGGGSVNGGGAIGDEEVVVKEEREEEKRIVLTAVVWFGRELVPWVHRALTVGVYKELERNRDVELEETNKRVEKLVAKIEGREWVDPEQIESLTSRPPVEQVEEPVLLSEIPADGTLVTEPENGREDQLNFGNGDDLANDIEAPTQDASSEQDQAPYLVNEVAPPPPVVAADPVGSTVSQVGDSL
ncbi:uncharacterized protein JCM15063_000526 [Sporobolomyces koalae]|uniref:uncharacterized protein n=1 Tax=Sporobolomyces koalae TaxID=500713 RepID=UPI003170990A